MLKGFPDTAGTWPGKTGSFMGTWSIWCELRHRHQGDSWQAWIGDSGYIELPRPGYFKQQFDVNKPKTTASTAKRGEVVSNVTSRWTRVLSLSHY